IRCGARNSRRVAGSGWVVREAAPRADSGGTSRKALILIPRRAQLSFCREQSLVSAPYAQPAPTRIALHTRHSVTNSVSLACSRTREFMLRRRTPIYGFAVLRQLEFQDRFPLRGC